MNQLLPMKLCQFKLKRFRDDWGRSVNILNKFDLSQLEQLEIHLIDLNDDVTLSLPSLRIFKAFEIVTHGYEFKINVNKLQVLGCEFGIDQVEITNPHTVQCIYNGYRGLYLDVYRETQVYKCSWAHYYDSGILDKLPNLSEFHLVKSFDKFDYDHVKRTMDYLVEQKIQLKRNKLKLYFHDTLIEDDKVFDDYDFRVKYQHLFKQL